MNIDRKYRIFATNPSSGSTHDERDAVLFLAKDAALPATLRAYQLECEKLGANPEHIESIGLLIDRVEQYQSTVFRKVPDTDRPGEIQRCLQGELTGDIGLPPLSKGLAEEKQALDDKREEMLSLFHRLEFQGVPARAQNYMYRQYAVMGTYSSILGERIVEETAHTSPPRLAEKDGSGSYREFLEAKLAAAVIDHAELAGQLDPDDKALTFFYAYTDGLACALRLLGGYGTTPFDLAWAKSPERPNVDYEKAIGDSYLPPLFPV